MAQKLGKHRTKRRILQWFPIRNTQPAKHAKRHPIDQQTLDILRIRALWLPGTTQVMYVAVNGRAIPIPIPQKNRTIKKKVNDVQKQDRKPKIDVIIASTNKNLYLPYLSEYVSMQDPIDTPKQTKVMRSDLSNLSRSHSTPSFGMSRPSTIVSHPSEKSRTYNERMSFYWPGPNPILFYKRESMLS